MDITPFVGILSFIGLAIGVFYNIGYFTALDLNLFPLLSYKDHLETLVFFIPSSFVPILLFAGLRRDARWRKWANIASGALAAGAIGGWLERDQIVGFPLLRGIVELVVLFASFLLLTYCTAIVLEKLAELGGEQDAQRIQEMTPATIGVLVFVTLLGNVKAHLSVDGSRFDTEISLKAEDQGKSDKHFARLVRAIDGGLLVIFQDAPKQLSYVRYEVVVKLAEPLDP